MKLIIQILVSAIIFIGCNVNNPNEKNIINYYPLNVNDEKQMIYIGDSTTYSYVIKEKIKRADGKEIYMEICEYGNAQRYDTNYYYIDNGWLVNTCRDTLRDSVGVIFDPQDVFNEQYFLQQNIQDSVWKQGKNDSCIMRKMKMIVEKETFACKFNNVAEITLEVLETVSKDIYYKPIMKIYYANNIGWICSETIDSANIKMCMTYAKIGNISYGKKWPSKSMAVLEKNNSNKFLNNYNSKHIVFNTNPINTDSKRTNKLGLINLMGCRIKPYKNEL